ncbi:hypothetical protein CERSUDRAFT_101766 [Gelatoporia subvermispora B]|uniref:Uncharacterized protein n=1 Tax=Ceriporiopsis subvermispora (strain B) TaxID=914234 RepID=M2PWJ6_CERS8|nr:hypothetical protein CERSUDRAFT_101766 [Gelatoporia subvermispora B]
MGSAVRRHSAVPEEPSHCRIEVRSKCSCHGISPPAHVHMSAGESKGYYAYDPAELYGEHDQHLASWSGTSSSCVCGPPTDSPAIASTRHHQFLYGGIWPATTIACEVLSLRRLEDLNILAMVSNSQSRPVRRSCSVA